MSYLSVIFSTSQYKAVTNISQQISGLVAGKTYRLTVDAPCYVNQGANPTASAGNGSVLVTQYSEGLIIQGADGAKLAIITGTTANATIVEVVGAQLR